MSLPIYQRVAVTDAGDIIPGAEYTVINENTGVAAPIYLDRAGATLLTAPYFADAAGTIQFYIAQGTTFRVAASGGVGTYTDRYVYGVAAAVLALADGSATINRVGSDGSALSIQKDGTTAGSIGMLASFPYIGKGDVTLLFVDSSDQIIPRGVEAAQRTGVISLGDTSNKFKDIHLAGGVVFGDAGGSGTSSSNKLDDYEEGTWTPTGTGISPVTCYYTKIGRQVYCMGYFSTSATVSSFSGLPFAFTGSTGGRSLGTSGYNNFTNTVMSILQSGDANSFAFYVGPTSQSITTGNVVYFNLTYITNE